MKTRALKIVAELRSSFWFVPALMVLLAGGLAVGLLLTDRRLEELGASATPWLFSGGAEAARGLLSAIATSIVTVTGVTFSITVVALTLAAQQYTPRVLREFTADPGNQIVLGTFVGTFVYTLIVLRTVRTDENGSFVPELAITGAVVLALISIGLLVFFIHHVTASLQPNFIVQTVARDTHRMLDHLFPERAGEEAPEEALERLPEEESHGRQVVARQDGYLQTTDVTRLLRIARKEDLIIRVHPRIGDYVPHGCPLAMIWPSGRTSQEIARRVESCFGLGRDRTMQQDPEFGILQIVDIAVRALSPGINDPNTAMTCLDYLGDLLRHAAGRRVPSPCRLDEDGQLRVIVDGTNFQRLADRAFHQIRQYGASSPGLTIHLLETIRLIADAAPNGARREMLREHVRRIAAGARQQISHPHDRADVLNHVSRTLAALEARSVPDRRAAA